MRELSSKICPSVKVQHYHSSMSCFNENKKILKLKITIFTIRKSLGKQNKLLQKLSNKNANFLRFSNHGNCSIVKPIVSCITMKSVK